MSSTDHHRQQQPYSNKPNGYASSSSLSPLNNSNNNSMSSHTSQASQNLLNEEYKLNLTSKMLNNTDSTLNCLQFINLIQYYFSETTPVTQAKTSNVLSLSTSPTNLMAYRPEQNDNSLHAGRKKANSAVISTCFPCIVCSSQFSFEQTFHLHLERRSVLIRFFCLKCECFKTFYNPCKLLYHIYSHKHFIFEAIYKSIKVESITLERLSMSKEKNIDLFRNSLVSNASKDSNNGEIDYILRPQRIQVNDNEQIKLFLRRLLLNKYMLYKCALCDALFFDAKDLKQHFQRSQQLELDKLNIENPNKSLALNRRILYKHLKQKFTSAFSHKNFKWLDADQEVSIVKTNLFVDLLNNFSFKKLQFSTRCSTIASMNLINSNFQFFIGPDNNSRRLNASILVCPECGMSFNALTDEENFRNHLIYSCHFTMKFDCCQIKCPNCSIVCDSITDFVQHWSKDHVKNQHECALCDQTNEKFIFREDISNEPDSNAMSPSSHTSSTDLNDKNSNQVFKQILGDKSPLEGVTEPNEFKSNISDINKHFFEKHRNMKVSLKLVYNCMCKSPESSLNDTVKEASQGASCNGNSSGCFHSTWKSCYSHIISIIHRTLASLTCLICKKLIPNEKYIGHLKSEHQIEKITVCPLCGVLKEAVTLGSHINQEHSSVNLNERPDSAFFNLLVTLNSKNTDKTGEATIDMLSSSALSEDFFVYQCLNCHQFFPSDCSFSHNCWTYNTVSVNKSNDQKQPPLTNNNYFSPIFLKFNVSKVLNSRALQTTTMASSAVSNCQIINEKSINSSNENSSDESGNLHKKFKSNHSTAPVLSTNQYR